MRRWVIRGAALVALALASFVGKMLADAGVFRTIRPHFAGRSQAIPGVVGAEDLEYSAASGTLFISADNRPAQPGEPTACGAIWALAASSTLPTNLTTGFAPEHEFHPHGMASWDLAGSTRLWVINHGVDETSIDVFTCAGGKLSFERSLRDPLLKNANDLVAVDEARFYATHDHGSASHAGGRLEDYSRIGRGYVTFFNGKDFAVKAEGIRFANGIVFSQPPSEPTAKLLVASMLGRSIRIYSRDAATADLTLDREMPLDTAPDNLSRDDEGTIWVGAHPKLFSLKAMNDDRAKRAPAQVLRIRGIVSGTPQVEEVFLDDGKLISAASVAFHQRGRLLIGSVFDDHLLDCRL